MSFEIRARRFFRGETSCERKIFCERLPDVAARARKTSRLEEALLAIALELGGRAGARLALELGIVAARGTLLKRIKGAPLPGIGKVRVLGVDDFAFKKGSTYGTVLVNLERREVVGLLPERSQESLVARFERHPDAEVEVATRDRSNVYREGLAKGAPGVTHVADRWHPLHNLTLTLEDCLLQKRPIPQKAAAPEAAPEEKDDADFAPGPTSPERPRTRDAKIEEAARKRHERLVERWRNIRRLYTSQKPISGTSAASSASARGPSTATRISPSRPTASCLQQEARERPRPVRAVPREALERGLPQRQASLPGDPRARVRQQRGDLRPFHRPTPSRRGSGEADLVRAASEAGLRRGALSHGEERGRVVHAQGGKPERGAGEEYLDWLCEADEALADARGPTQEFAEMVGRLEGEDPDGWLKDAEESDSTAMRSFAVGLRKVLDAVRAGLTEEWSNGCVEGFIHKLKSLKRQGYGRAGFELLRARMLAA